MPGPHKNSLSKVLPAYAGMIPLATRKNRTSTRAPRVCGDDPDGVGVLLC